MLNAFRFSSDCFQILFGLSSFPRAMLSATPLGQRLIAGLWVEDFIPHKARLRIRR